MDIDILNLGISAFARVCRYVTDKSILRMREVSKMLKKVLENSITTIQKTDTVNDCRKLTLHFWNSELVIWNFCLLAKLGFDGITKSEGTLVGIFKPGEATDLITYLGPLINRAKFFRMSFYDDQIEIIHVLSKFVAKDSVKYLRVYELRSESSNFATWFGFVKKINQMKIEYCIEQLSNESLQRLTLLADHVEDMQVGVNKGFTANTEEKEIEIAQAILRRKCDYLAFNFSFNNRKISPYHAEKMLKFIHNQGRRVVFESKIDQNAMDLQVGEFRLKISPIGHQLGSSMTIKHVEVNNLY